MSTIKTNTLTGTTSAGSINVTGEGGSTTTNLQQGLCKHWTTVDATVPEATDSLNESSITDNGYSDITYNFTNNMNNDDYSTGSLCTYNITSNPYTTLGFFGDVPTTSAYRTHGFYSTTMRGNDYNRGTVNTFGDLA